MTRLLSPFARVKLADRNWHFGDGYLKEVSVTLAEGSKDSSCSFTIYDPGRTFTDSLLEFIEEVEGLEPLEVPQKQLSTGVAGGTGTSSGELSVNMRAALDTIAWAEGGEYNILFGGSTFDSYADHPAPGSLTAAGRYQIQGRTWNEIREGLPDFSPKSQDIAAVRLIERRGATADVEAGNIPAALVKLSYEWAALPYA